MLFDVLISFSSSLEIYKPPRLYFCAFANLGSKIKEKTIIVTYKVRETHTLLSVEC